MKLKTSDYEKLLYLFVDLLVLNAAFAIGFILEFKTGPQLYQSDYLILFVFINFAWLLIVKVNSYNLASRKVSTADIFRNFLKILAFNIILTLAFTAIVIGKYSAIFILKYYTLFFLFGGLARIGFSIYLKSYRKIRDNFKRIVVLGVNSFSIEFVNDIITHSEYGYKFMGFFSYKNSEDHENVRIEKFEKIYDFLLEYEIDEVYISLPSAPDYNIKTLIKFCQLNYIKVNFLNEFLHLLSRKTIQVDLDYNGPTPIVSVVKEPLEETTNKFLKRIFDITFSLGVIVFLFSWLYPIIAILIKMESKGPVLFKQRRTGLDNNPFYCYKFRTMRPNKDSDTKQAEENDCRITKIGAFLRKSSLDELPQFFNVLKGEMSVVGPRPHMLEHTRIYSKLIEPFMIRHWVKPGITGLAQIKGFRGETKEIRQMYQRVRMDVFYIQNWNFAFDLKMIFKTVLNIVTNSHTGR